MMHLANRSARCARLCLLQGFDSCPSCQLLHLRPQCADPQSPSPQPPEHSVPSTADALLTDTQLLYHTLDYANTAMPCWPPIYSYLYSRSSMSSVTSGATAGPVPSISCCSAFMLVSRHFQPSLPCRSWPIPA